MAAAMPAESAVNLNLLDVMDGSPKFGCKLQFCKYRQADYGL